MNGDFSATFTLWDHLFGTYVDPEKEPGEFELGLAEPTRPVRMVVGV